MFSEPVAVRRSEAQRFLWGDEESGQVSDLIYGRGEQISAVIYLLGPGHGFRASTAWKPLYDQHRFYYVAQGTLAIHDPDTGDVAVAGPGEAVTWRGTRYHFGYNVGADEVVVLDWFAPTERPMDVPESELSGSKRTLDAVVDGRWELLGAWPDRRAEELSKAAAEGRVTRIGEDTALHVIQGSSPPVVVSVLTSSRDMTAGTFTLQSSTKMAPETHPGDEVVFALGGRLHVLLQETGDWLELEHLDCAFIPAGARHQYWCYGDGPVRAVFCVAPGYR
jgi:quercetin dioxygenase-like cupin family protein